MNMTEYLQKRTALREAVRQVYQPSPTVPHITRYVNQVFAGDCVQVLKWFPSTSVDFVLTNPPYLVDYHSRDGRSYQNDNPNDPLWVAPAFAEIARVMKPNSFCVCFFGAFKVDVFMRAWRKAELRPVGFFSFLKDYPSSEGHIKWHSEHAYLLAKGSPRPQHVIENVLPFHYTGNHMHPAEKSPETLKPLIEAFSQPEDIVLDPFIGSGSPLVAAKGLGRHVIGIDIDRTHVETAWKRLQQSEPGYR